jgi:hypothetical protein
MALRFLRKPQAALMFRLSRGNIHSARFSSERFFLPL